MTEAVMWAIVITSILAIAVLVLAYYGLTTKCPWCDGKGKSAEGMKCEYCDGKGRR